MPMTTPNDQINDMEEVVRQSQRYSATLQSYNTRWGAARGWDGGGRDVLMPLPPWLLDTLSAAPLTGTNRPTTDSNDPTEPNRTQQQTQPSLQNDINAEKARRDEVVKAREELQSQVAELGGLVKSGERMLQLEKVREGGAAGGLEAGRVHSGIRGSVDERFEVLV
jgi:hypothetical protein